jgi:uncharacterized protein
MGNLSGLRESTAGGRRPARLSSYEMNSEHLAFYLDRIERIKERLEKCEPRRRVLFAACCCERLLPNYDAFVAMEKWGDPSVLRLAVDEIWAFLKGHPLHAARVRELLSACDSVTPSTMDFGSLFVSAALDCVVSIMETLECCLDGDPRHSAEVAQAACDTVVMYLDACCDPETGVHSADPMFDKWVHASPLLAGEMQRQDETLRDIELSAYADADSLDRLRQRARLGGIQPFERGLLIEPS